MSQRMSSDEAVASEHCFHRSTLLNPFCCDSDAFIVSSMGWIISGVQGIGSMTGCTGYVSRNLLLYQRFEAVPV